MLAAGIFLLALLSGCVGERGPPLDPNTVPLDAPSEGGSGGHDLVVTVPAEFADGQPIHGAAVAVYYERDNRSGDAAAIGLRTDMDGKVLAHVDRDSLVGIVVGFGDGWTIEWKPGVVTSGSGNQLTIPLYRSAIQRTWTVDVEEPLGGTGSKVNPTSDDVLWWPSDALFNEDGAVDAAYAARLSEIEIDVRWTNGATQYADLGVGIGPRKDEPAAFADEETDTPGEGAVSERLELDIDALRREGLRNVQRLYVGPGTQAGYAAPLGLQVEVTVKAEFDTFLHLGYNASSQDSPAGGLLGTLAALAAVGWVAGRHRR